jgi:hypothetical protein
LDANKVFSYLFWLSVLLIMAAYFVGVSTDASVFGGVINSLGNTFTGRNSQGQFANYPSGGGTAP